MSVVVDADTDAAINAAEQKIAALELFARKHRLRGANLPQLPPARVFRNQKALYNALDSTVLRIENIAAKLPRNVSYGRSHIQAKLIDYDPGEAFFKKVQHPLQQLKQAAVDISKLGKEFGPPAATILEQTSLFETSVRAQATLITRASKMAKPTDPTALKKECEPLVDASSDVADLKYEVNVRSKLHDHAMALGDAAAALGWVVSPASLKHVREYNHIVNNLSSNILANYIELGCNPVHSNFAEALNAFVAALVEYVEKEHPAGLRWNYAQGATPLGYRRAQRNVRKDSHPIGDFYRLMHSALTEFVLICCEFGKPLKTISDFTIGAYEEMAKAIETASNRKKPEGDPTAPMKMLLISVQNELTALVSVLDDVKEGDKFYMHCAAFREFITSLQWCTAIVQKMSPVGFIIDIETVTLLYLKKIDDKFEKGEKTYTTRLHLKWTQSVRDMLTEMKEYVKLHHPNELMFDTQRSRKSIDSLIQTTSLTNQLSELRKKSTSQHWVKKTTQRMTARYGRRNVKAWVKK